MTEVSAIENPGPSKNQQVIASEEEKQLVIQAAKILSSLAHSGEQKIATLMDLMQGHSLSPAGAAALQIAVNEYANTAAFLTNLVKTIGDTGNRIISNTGGR